MNITVRMTAKQLRKAIANNSASKAFSIFRHEGTDYDAKWKSGKYDYAVVARQVAIEALKLSNDKAFVAAVAEYAAAKGIM